MSFSYRWVWLFAIWMLLFCVSCGSKPACPDCDVMNFEFKNLSIPPENAPKAGVTWGRVEIVLSPKAGDTWKIKMAKSFRQKKGEAGWTFQSKVNNSKSVLAVILGTADGKGSIKVDSVGISVWLGKDDVNNLTSNKGLKIRLRLTKKLANPLQPFQVSGSVRHVKLVGSENKEFCQALFVLGEKTFAQSGASFTVQNQCTGSPTTCWAACSK